MINRYPGTASCRLDTEEDDPQIGPAVDLSRGGRHLARLWVRESGIGAGVSAGVNLTADDVLALRDGCTRLLLAAGVITDRREGSDG